MKKLSRVFATRPTINISIILLSIGLMINTWTTLYANDYEEDLILENWMTVPFEMEFSEADLQMEDWMKVPFEMEFTEDDLQLEDWMTKTWI